MDEPRPVAILEATPRRRILHLSQLDLLAHLAQRLDAWVITWTTEARFHHAALVALEPAFASSYEMVSRAALPVYKVFVVPEMSEVDLVLVLAIQDIVAMATHTRCEALFRGRPMAPMVIIIIDGTFHGTFHHGIILPTRHRAQSNSAMAAAQPTAVHATPSATQ
jgi:hypothetical protein